MFIAAKRPGTPVLPGAAVIAVEEINISRQMILPVRCSGIHVYRKLVQPDGAAVYPDVIFFHKKNLAF